MASQQLLTYQLETHNKKLIASTSLRDLTDQKSDFTDQFKI